MKIMAIFGTRPEAIKLCPIIKILQQQQKIRTLICLSGQQKQLTASILKSFNLSADYDLDIMSSEQTLSEITSNILCKLPPLLLSEKPDLVLIHGDTATAFATALTCFYLKIPSAHIEAGLRTYEPAAPFPEEFNRRAISLLTQYHFAPTLSAEKNLLNEGLPPNTIFTFGNTVIDALTYTIRNNYHHPLLEWAQDSRLLFLTIHRRENLGMPLKRVFQAIRALVQLPQVKIIYPIHPRASIRLAAQKELGHCPQIFLSDPLDVVDFHNILLRSTLVLTDSGGVSEEAAALGKPTLIIREFTERWESLANRNAVLVGVDTTLIIKTVSELLNDRKLYHQMSQSCHLYGDGHASEKIVAVLENILTKNKADYKKHLKR